MLSLEQTIMHIRKNSPPLTHHWTSLPLTIPSTHQGQQGREGAKTEVTVSWVLTTELISHHLCLVLLIRSITSLACSQGEEITQRCEYQQAGIFGGHLSLTATVKHFCLVTEVQESSNLFFFLHS